MTETDRPDFAAGMVGLAEVFGEELSTERGALYFVALQDLPIEQVRDGIGRCIRAAKFFPRPIEIRAAALHTDVEGAQQKLILADWERKHSRLQDDSWLQREARSTERQRAAPAPVRALTHIVADVGKPIPAHHDREGNPVQTPQEREARRAVLREQAAQLREKTPA